MAGSTDPTTAVEKTAPKPSAGLWQAPVFVLGVGILIAVGLSRPLLAPHNSATPVRRELQEARRLLDNPNGDSVQAAKLAESVLEEKDKYPGATGEADLLLGTSLMRQAAQAEGAKASELWAQARQRLEAADKEKISDRDRARLQYRLGIVGYHTHDKLEDVVRRIKASIDQADDPVEGYTVLTQGYLNLDKPDLEAALDANLKLRNLSEAKEDVLAPARLLGGELELQLKHPDLARRVLEKVGARATPEIKAKALRLRARSFQDENHWAEAAGLWQEAKADGQRPSEVLYNLGVCAERQGQTDEAARFWEECIQAGGDETRPAALALAALRLKGPNPETALEMLAIVVDKTKPAQDSAHPLADQAAVLKLFQEAGKTYLDKHNYDLAVRLAEPFEHVGAPGEAEELRAKASAEWARVRQEEARRAETPVAKQTAQEAADNLFRQAATAYGAALELSVKPADKAEFLWLSAHCSWEGRDLEQAAAKFEAVLHLEAPADQQKEGLYIQRQGEGWFLLGEARRRLKDLDRAEAAYMKCISYPSNYAYRARYYLALGAVTKGQLDGAQEMLEQNLNLLRDDPDPEAQEMSLYALGDLLYRRGNYRMVVQRLGAAVKHFPANPEATHAHYQLADSYRQLADQPHLDAKLDGNGGKGEETRKHALDEHLVNLTNARDEFQKLAELLDQPEGQGLLKAEEQVQVPFYYANCLFDLGEYTNAFQAYQTLAGRYAGKPQSLNALSGMVRCDAALGETEKMQKTIGEMEALLPKMPATAREQWSEWLTVVRKPIAGDE
jgi:tetratricopeptide (TPR) repeat protein